MEFNDWLFNKTRLTVFFWPTEFVVGASFISSFIFVNDIWGLKADENLLRELALDGILCLPVEICILFKPLKRLELVFVEFGCSCFGMLNEFLMVLGMVSGMVSGMVLGMLKVGFLITVGCILGALNFGGRGFECCNLVCGSSGD